MGNRSREKQEEGRKEIKKKRKCKARKGRGYIFVVIN